MFDEAHFNVHTTGTGYKAFAEMMANDGYQITPNKDRFNRNTLKGFQVLVIANALGAANPEDHDAARPAFTNEECDVVRDWVRGGGALLLITDHEPAASAAENMATRFEVGTGKNFAVDKSNYFTRTGWAGNLVFSRDKGLLAEHPIINGRDATERINRVLTFGGRRMNAIDPRRAMLRTAPSRRPVSCEMSEAAARVARRGRRPHLLRLHRFTYSYAAASAGFPCLADLVAKPAYSFPVRDQDTRSATRN
jgi:hypothetical protein